MISRKQFLLNSIGLAGATYFGSVFTSCSPSKKVTGILTGPNKDLGHRLRQQLQNPKIDKTIHHDVLIVGGGVSGLAAARYLTKNNVNVALIELEKRTGGNSQYGTNDVSAYPLGAHYLPLPSNNDPELIDFLKSCNVITGFENGLPLYNEYYLCFDPKERLFIHQQWQEGLIPRAGVPAADRDQLERFHQLIEKYKQQKGSDGKDAFCIPVSSCSTDIEFKNLDSISFADFLTEQNFSSEYLMWYVNYCCADDYGANAKDVSAWAGIHYFASRKGTAANATSDQVLTWPEGNGWLVKELEKNIQGKIISNSLVFSIEIKEGKAVATCIDGETGSCTEVIANKIILATPQFINQRILSPSMNRSLDYSAFTYAPWMVANLTLSSNLENKRGEPLCWDNVIYKSSSLGYVHANHQNVGPQSNRKVITYYQPLTDKNIKDARQEAFDRTYEQWYELILKDLRKPHPHIETELENLDIWIWGHGMICPSPGLIFGENRQRAMQPIDNKIYFAHSDCSGISIFEEAFYQGTRAAKQVLQT